MVIYMNMLNLKNNKLLPFYSWPLAAPRPSIWDVKMSLLGDRNGLCIWEFCVGVIFGIGWFRSVPEPDEGQPTGFRLLYYLL